MIKANFDAYNSYVTDSVHQWEINRTLSVGGLNLAVAPEVHFSNASMDKAIVRQATLSSHVVNVQIPNSLLQAPLAIDAYIGVYEGNAFKVIEHVRIPIIPRERPADYRIENDEEVYSFEALRNALANKADSAVINARVDNIIAHNNDTNGNTELIDIRVGADGKTYSSAGEAVRGQLLTTADIYNVTYKHPLASGFYTLESAIVAVPETVRKSGLIVTFRVQPEKWEQYQYFAKDASPTNWTNLAYWSNNGYDSKTNNIYRGIIRDLGYTSFAECTLYGHYRFFSADVANITDAPSGLTRAGNLFVYPYFGGTSAKFIRDLDGNEWFMHTGIDWICTNKNNEARITNLENTVSDLIDRNLRWCALGDSITQGYYSYYDETGGAAYALDSSASWTKYVERLNGYTLTNKAVGGSGYLCIRTADNPVDNAREVADATDFSQFDLVTLAFGVNDWKYNCALGSIEDDATIGNSMYSNMRYVIEKILSDNPLCKIVVITPINCAVSGSYSTNWGLGHAYSNNGTLEDIFGAIVEVCKYYGVEYIDMTHNSIVNRENIGDLLIDKVHPSKDCHRVLGYELAKKIKF